MQWEDKGVNIDGRMLNHLKYTNDVVLNSTSFEELQMINELENELGKVGLQLNKQKPKLSLTRRK